MTTTTTLKEKSESKLAANTGKDETNSNPRIIATNPSANSLRDSQGKGTQGKSSNLCKLRKSDML